MCGGWTCSGSGARELVLALKREELVVKLPPAPTLTVAPGGSSYFLYEAANEDRRSQGPPWTSTPGSPQREATARASGQTGLP